MSQSLSVLGGYDILLKHQLTQNSPYFDQLIRKLEPLMYELSQTPDSRSHGSTSQIIRSQ